MNRARTSLLLSALVITIFGVGCLGEEKIDRTTSARWLVENPADGPRDRKAAKDIAEDEVRSSQSAPDPVPGVGEEEDKSKSCTCP